MVTLCASRQYMISTVLQAPSPYLSTVNEFHKILKV